MVETSPSIEPYNLSRRSNLDLYTGIEYFDSLCAKVDKTVAGDRVAIATMSLDATEPAVENVLEHLHSAAERKVNVTFCVDAFAVLAPRAIGSLVLPLPLGRSIIKKNYDALDYIADEDTAECGVINMPKSKTPNLFAGRSHLKHAVVNNYVYLGGPSFHGCDRTDMVVGFEDTRTADWMHDLTVDMTEQANTDAVLGSNDQIWPVDDQSRILIDAGVPGQSLIMEETYDFIDQADEWITIACQYLPTGEIGDRLNKAIEKGVDVNIVYNHPSKHDRLNVVHYIILAREKLRRRTEFFANQMPQEKPILHTKAIANEKRAMVGSHNMTKIGVKLGTPEIMLESRDATFAKAVRQLIMREVQMPNNGWLDLPAQASPA
jgi:hypothetical protein